MAFIKVEKCAIRGISGCVPSQVEENIDLPFYSSKEEAEQVIAATGIERRHVSPKDITASDLCLKAAEKLIQELGWEKDTIDLLAFCTQTSDYLNHPNSFVVHEKLGLKESTMCLDFFHGCPGWVVSLSSVSQLVGGGNIKRAILLDGDTVSKVQNKNNREERPLFGDAGTATALEYDESASPIYFNIGTKSEDGVAIASLDGGYRNPFTIESLSRRLKAIEGTLPMEEVTSKMDSMDVFSFAITKVPKSIKKLCSEFSLDLAIVDNLVLHQANKLIIDNIAKRLKMPSDKVLLGLCNYGNTTSASIPMAMVSERAKVLSNKSQKNLVCGFGTGLAWGAAFFETIDIKCPDIIEL